MTYWIEAFKLWLRMTYAVVTGLLQMNLCPWVDGFGNWQIQKDMLRVYGRETKRLSRFGKVPKH